MSVLELVLVILLLAVLLGLVAMVIRRPTATGPSDAVLAALADLGALKSHVETVSSQQGALSQSLGMLQAAVQGVETKVLESSAGVREAIGKDLSDARIVVERLKVDGEERRRMEEDVQASARRIETVLLGSRTRGALGKQCGAAAASSGRENLCPGRIRGVLRRATARRAWRLRHRAIAA